MGRVNYRIVTLTAALGGAIMSGVSLAFLVTALIEYRAKDFFTATTTTNFVSLGTCVETLTHDQLKELDYKNPSIDCKDSVKRGNKKKLINTLRATVHGVYWTYYNGQIDDRTGEGTTVPANTFHDTYMKGEFLREVMTAQWGHVLGKTHPFYTEGKGGTQASFVNIGLNFTHVYEALSLVAEVVGGVPATCEDIYNMSYTDISDDHLLASQEDGSGSVEEGGSGSGEAPLTTDGIYHDTPYEAFIKGIREGRLDDKEKTKTTWPLQEFEINCPDEETTEGVDYLPAGLEPNNGQIQADLTPEQKKYMYAHCVAQFQFASVGTQAWEGTYGIPLPGIEPGPFFYPYPQADGFNSSASYTMRARMYLGQRFGLSIWAYVPMFLATCFLLGDCIVFFFAEALMPITIADQVNFASNTLAHVRDSLVIASTSRSSRKKRLAIGFVAVLVSIFFYSLFIAAPWGLFYTSLPRPHCEKEPGTKTMLGVEVGASPDHGVPQTFWLGTKGGWQTDYDATWYDLMALLFQVLVLFLLPITTSPLCRSLNNSVKQATNGRTTDTGVREAAQRVSNEAAYRFTQRVLVLPMILGIFIVIVGQSVSGARFGWAWAEGVVAQEMNEDQTGPLFDEVELSEHVYDQTIATLAATTACGLVFAVAMQRHLINGVGCFSAGLFFGWCALVLIFGLPLIFYSMSRSIFIEDDANEDCAVFPRTSHEFENDLCIARFWTLLIGGGIFVAAVLVITALGLLEAFPAIFANRSSASVPIPDAQEESALMRKTGPGSRVNAPFFSGPKEVTFKPQLAPKKRSSTPNDFLYGGKLRAPAPRR